VLRWIGSSRVTVDDMGTRAGGATGLIVSTPFAAWWLNGGQLATARTSIEPATERLVGISSLVLFAVSALTLTVVAVRERRLDRGWSWVVGTLVTAGPIAGVVVPTLTLAGVESYAPVAIAICYCFPVIGALLVCALGRSLFLLTAGRRRTESSFEPQSPFEMDSAFGSEWADLRRP
jgi:hypothetical protein